MAVRYTSEAKCQARLVTLIEAWRCLTGLKALPFGREFVTLCASLTDDGRTIKHACELDQMVKAGLITPEQYYGVEGRDWLVHEANVSAVAAAFPEKRPVLVFDEIAHYVDCHAELHPAIVNLDFINGPEATLAKLVKVLSRLGAKSGPTMVVWNVPTFSKYHDLEAGFNLVPEHLAYHQVLAAGAWKPCGEYAYAGASGHSPMKSTVYFRKAV